jgi:hypothetical protein
MPTFLTTLLSWLGKNLLGSLSSPLSLLSKVFPLLNLRYLVYLALAVAALAASGVMGYQCGQRQEALRLKPELDEKTKLAGAADERIAALQGSVDAIVKGSAQVDDARAQLRAQAESTLKALDDRIIVLRTQQIPRTGNECVDAKQVARAYFDDLRKANGGAK